MNVLVIDDEKLIAAGIVKIMRTIPQLNMVHQAHDFNHAYHKISSGVYDLFLIDINLEDQHDGVRLCQLAKQKYPDVPVVMVTAMASESYLEPAFAVGANDYITKPFAKNELKLRAERWLALAHKVAWREDISYHSLRYSIPQHRFYNHGQVLDLSKQEKTLLLLFLKHAEQILSPRWLEEKLWGDYDNFKSRNIRSNIQYLRQDLNKQGRLGSWICNQPGEGYQLFRQN